MSERHDEEARGELDLDGPWRIGEESFAMIVEDIRSLEPRRVMEFGSGASSIRLAQALPRAQVYAIEHDDHYFYETRAMLKRHPTLSNLDVDPRPLRWQRHHGALFYSYMRGPIPSPLDAVVIDGPPRIYRGGREACLYQVYDNLRVGGRVYLDDCERDGELRAIANWLWRYDEEMGECVRFLEGRHNVCVFEKRKHVERPRRSLALSVESGFTNLRNLRDALNRRRR